jgi:hypothetical protein
LNQNRVSKTLQGVVGKAARRATLSGRHTSGLTRPLDRTEAWPKSRVRTIRGKNSGGWK